MIIDYDHNPNITDEQRTQSLKESVQMALNEIETNITTINKQLEEIRKAISND